VTAKHLFFDRLQAHTLINGADKRNFCWYLNQ